MGSRQKCRSHPIMCSLGSTWFFCQVVVLTHIKPGLKGILDPRPHTILKFFEKGLHFDQLELLYWWSGNSSNLVLQPWDHQQWMSVNSGNKIYVSHVISVMSESWVLDVSSTTSSRTSRTPMFLSGFSSSKSYEIWTRSPPYYALSFNIIITTIRMTPSPLKPHPGRGVHPCTWQGFHHWNQ